MNKAEIWHLPNKARNLYGPACHHEWSTATRVRASRTVTISVWASVNNVSSQGSDKWRHRENSTGWAWRVRLARFSFFFVVWHTGLHGLNESTEGCMLWSDAIWQAQHWKRNARSSMRWSNRRRSNRRRSRMRESSSCRNMFSCTSRTFFSS